ncbi:hypothetical protein IKG60_01310 [Candidatus Saccharibacteria bacterium]|nr:hypothetical protein [Candidatus Saccharibacteria bacterium]
MAREINLVPDIKDDMIRALKLRNFIFFLSFVIAAGSVGVTVFAGIIAGGQGIALSNREGTIKALSEKLNSYSDLKDFLTIRNQLGNIATTTEDKTVFSRTFNILSALLPHGLDTIQISELHIDLSDENPVFRFDAQANAGQSPYIDYNVLDAFKKSLQYMRYDYGKYVDKNGDDIPAYCMIESGDDGSFFNDPSRGLYAYWTITAEGCAPYSSDVSAEATDDVDDAEDDSVDGDETSDESTPTADPAAGYTTEEYNGQRVVRVWRTPQFNEWYRDDEADDAPYMGLDGEISGVPHFVSSCITYTGEIKNEGEAPKWTESNEECTLVPEGVSGIEIDPDSSNGRGEDGELVLRFSAAITFTPEVYNFNNHHMIALAPGGRRNVTDSYVQIQAMFGERAADCEEGDTACKDNSNNSSGNSSNNKSNERNQNG